MARIPTPAPSPASRPSVHAPRFCSGRARPACSLPPPAPGGGINTISPPSKPSTPAPPTSLPPPLPPLAPVRPRPSLSLGTCPAGLLAAPSRSRRGLLITLIHTFGHNYCVSAPPSSGRFFSFAQSITRAHASLRFGLGTGDRPRKGFPAGAHHKSNS